MTLKRLLNRLLRGDKVPLGEISPTLRPTPVQPAVVDSDPRNDKIVIALNRISLEYNPGGVGLLFGDNPPEVWLVDRANVRERVRDDLKAMSSWGMVLRFVGKVFWAELPKP